MSKMIFNGLEFVAGQEINNNGVFVDTDNLIDSGTYTSEFTYMAIQDCCLLFHVAGTTSTSGKLYIDGIVFQGIYTNSSDNDFKDYTFLKKGQVAKITSSQNATLEYAVYGLQSGSISNVQHNYSTSEQLIGTWIDGKQLYERTKVVSFANFTHNNDTYFTPIASDNTETLRNVEAIAYSTGYGVCTLGSRAYSRDNTLSYYWELVEYYSNVALHFVGESVTDVGVTEVVITYRYTKTTD